MLTVRPATRSDIAAVAALFQTVFPEALESVFGRSRVPAVAVEDVFDLIYQFEPAGMCVAVDEGDVLGYMVVVSDRDQLIKALIWKGKVLTIIGRWVIGRYRGIGFSFVGRLGKAAWDYRDAESIGDGIKPAAQILSIAVHPKAQRRGIGAALSAAALSYLSTTPARVIRLEVDAAKPGPIALYQKLGFQEIGRMASPRGPALVMIKPLAEKSAVY